MAIKFNTAIYFNNYGKPGSYILGNSALPISTGMVKESRETDWLNIEIEGIGKQETILSCRAMPYRKIEDFHDFFAKNEVILYKLYVSQSGRIIKILKIRSYNLMKSEISGLNNPFPTYNYSLSSRVNDVNYTDDKVYKTHIDFYIKYSENYQKEGAASIPPVD